MNKLALRDKILFFSSIIVIFFMLILGAVGYCKYHTQAESYVQNSIRDLLENRREWEPLTFPGIAILAGLGHLALVSFFLRMPDFDKDPCRPWAEELRWDKFNLRTESMPPHRLLLPTAMLWEGFLMTFYLAAILSTSSAGGREIFLILIVIPVCIFCFLAGIKLFRGIFKRFPKIILKEFPAVPGRTLVGTLILPEKACSIDEVKLTLECRCKGLKPPVYQEDKLFEIKKFNNLGLVEFSFDVPKDKPQTTTTKTQMENAGISQLLAIDGPDQIDWNILIISPGYSDSIAVPVFWVENVDLIEVNDDYKTLVYNKEKLLG